MITKSRNTLRMSILVGAVVALAACSSGPTGVTTTTAVPSESTDVADSLPPSSDAPTTTTGTQIANPASVFCVEQGGTVEIVDEADGQVGYCNLPDGTRVEEWEYYRSMNPDAGDGESGLPGEGVQ